MKRRPPGDGGDSSIEGGWVVVNGSVVSIKGCGAMLEARAFARRGRCLWPLPLTAAPNFVPSYSGVLWLA